jgi:hypothetical protein
VLIRFLFIVSDSSSDDVVTLHIEKKKFIVEKECLVKNSDYFSAMFASGMQEAHSGIVTLKDANAEAMQKIIAHCKGTELTMTEASAFGLLAVASMYQFKQVIQECVQFLIKSLRTWNCLKIMFAARQLQIPELVEPALRYSLWEFDFVVQSQQFPDLTFEQVCEYLDYIMIRTKCEMRVYQAVKCWIKKNRVLAEKLKEEELEQLLETVRFRDMTKNEFQSVLDDDFWDTRGWTNVIRSFNPPECTGLHPYKVSDMFIDFLLSIIKIFSEV